MIRVLAFVLATVMGMTLYSTPAISSPPGGQSVTTTVVWPYGMSNNGNITAKFVTTPTADGTWSVAATFKPKIVVFSFLFGGGSMMLKGTATAATITGSGSPVAIAAPGCYWSFFGGGGQNPTVVNCTFTVATNGSVTVWSINAPLSF